MKKSIAYFIPLSLLLIPAIYFLLYFTPYYQDRVELHSTQKDHEVHIVQDEFEFEFVLNSNCSIENDFTSYIKRNRWQAMIICSDKPQGIVSISTRDVNLSESVAKEIERLLLFNQHLHSERIYIDEQEEYSQIYILNKEGNRYFYIRTTQILAQKILATIKEY